MLLPVMDELLGLSLLHCFVAGPCDRSRPLVSRLPNFARIGVVMHSFIQINRLAYRGFACLYAAGQNMCGSCCPHVLCLCVCCVRLIVCRPSRCPPVSCRYGRSSASLYTAFSS